MFCYEASRHDKEILATLLIRKKPFLLRNQIDDLLITNNIKNIQYIMVIVKSGLL